MTHIGIQSSLPMVSFMVWVGSGGVGRGEGGAGSVQVQVE